MIKVRIPTPLQKLTSGRSEVEIEGDELSLTELIEKLDELYPGIKERVMDENGIRRFINIYVNDEDIRFLNGEETVVRDGDTVSIVPALAGGMLTLDEERIDRYSRQIILPEVGGKGQEKLFNSKVLIVGVGGLGSPVALYLAAAGVGTIGIVDSDKVELNNLQRQILHSTEAVGLPKVDSALKRLKNLNPDVKVVPYNLRLSSENAMEIISEYDVIVDGSDNFPTRYLVNDACYLLKKPMSHGAILRFEGQAFTMIPNQTPCYRCLFPSPPPPGLVPSCQQAGILGAVAGVIGCIQAAEVLKLILGVGEPLLGRLLIFDALEMSFRTVKIPKNPKCPLCGENPTVRELIDYEEFCGFRRSDDG